LKGRNISNEIINKIFIRNAEDNVTLVSIKDNVTSRSEEWID